ncbi:MAG TPA: FAD binding domain-containing protein [Chitinophagaceae bacterium]|nr:FAD binding domain-containing protein [Chitinophagaceae bacterium]
MIQFILNNKPIATDLPPGMVLLDFIRYHQHLTGTKIGCREGDCGACTVLVGELVNGELKYESMTSCLVPLGNVRGKHIVSIEGINFPDKLNTVQQAMADCGATQCGFCTPGFVMSLAGFCLSDVYPTKENAVASVDGNICRCTGYKSIEKAAGIIAERLNGKTDSIQFVTEQNILPSYFSGIKEKLGQLRVSRLTPDVSREIVAGGTDLYVQKHDEMTHAAIEFVFDNTELNGIVKEGNRCIIGPSATVTDLRNSPVINNAFPNFHQVSKLISSTPIRNMATIAGNFVNASPIGDLTILFLALDATIELSDGDNSRKLPLRKFYKGYKQLDKKPGDIILRISFEMPGKNTYFNFEKVSKRTHLDIASVNTAICLEINNGLIEKAGLSAGGVGPIPMYLEKTSAYLKGKPLTTETVDGAIEVMKTEISPISDARGSKEYKTLLLGQLIRAHFINALK